MMLWEDPVLVALLETAYKSADNDGDRYVCINLLYEPRFPKYFVDALRKDWEADSSGGSEQALAFLQRRVKNYSDLARLSPQRCFCDRDSNEGNWLEREEFPSGKLATVLDLTGAIRRAQSPDADTLALKPDGADVLKEALEGLGLSLSPTAPKNIEAHFENWDFTERASQERILQFLGQLAYCLPKNPLWLAPHAEFEELILRDQPCTWLEAVGLPTPR
jgi:hypothetical protein